MSQENVDVVKRAIAAVNERDVEAYLACCTEDFQLRTPVAPIQGVYEGPDAIRRFFADVQDTVTDFRLDLEQLKGDRPGPSARLPPSQRIRTSERHTRHGQFAC